MKLNLTDTVSFVILGQRSQRRIPVFVMCTLVTGSPETPMEDKFSAATLADVLVDVPAAQLAAPPLW